MTTGVFAWMLRRKPFGMWTQVPGSPPGTVPVLHTGVILAGYAEEVCDPAPRRPTLASLPVPR